MSTIAADESNPNEHDLQAVAQLKASAARIKAELAKVIVGQEDVLVGIRFVGGCGAHRRV